MSHGGEHTLSSKWWGLGEENRVTEQSSGFVPMGDGGVAKDLTGVWYIGTLVRLSQGTMVWEEDRLREVRSTSITWFTNHITDLRIHSVHRTGVYPN